ncbi:MAG: hypothetical protein F6J93_34320 [Oscillatoria sp. SIO1A7]|nr:hypothetical protein [Oscillatoria sp. SIO1A7]
MLSHAGNINVLPAPTTSIVPDPSGDLPAIKMKLWIQGWNPSGVTLPGINVVEIDLKPKISLKVNLPLECRDYFFPYYALVGVVSDRPTKEGVILALWKTFEKDGYSKKRFVEVEINNNFLLNYQQEILSKNLIDCLAIPGTVKYSPDKNSYYFYVPDVWELNLIPDGRKILPGTGGKWLANSNPFLGGFPSGDSVQGVYGWLQPTETANAIGNQGAIDLQALESLLPIFSVPSIGSYRDDPPSWSNFCWHSPQTVPQGSRLTLQVFRGDLPDTASFDGAIQIVVRGIVNFDSGALRDDFDLAGVELYSIAGDGFFTLLEDLTPGNGIMLSIRAYFDANNFPYGFLQSQTPISISVTVRRNSSVRVPGALLWLPEQGGVIYPKSVEYDDFRVVPGNGLSIIALSGKALVKGYETFNKGRQHIYALNPEVVRQKITISQHGSVNLRGAQENLSSTEALLGLVSCGIGKSAAGFWSETIEIISGQGIQVLFNLPSDSEGNGTISKKYKYISNKTGRFNPPYLIVFIRASSGIVYQIPPVPCNGDPTQEIIITSLQGSQQVTTIPSDPSNDFSLFDPPSVFDAMPVGSGSLEPGNYKVCACYQYDGLQVTKIELDPDLGCVPLLEIPLIEAVSNAAYWKKPQSMESVLLWNPEEILAWSQIKIISPEGVAKNYIWNPYIESPSDGTTSIAIEPSKPGRFILLEGSENLYWKEPTTIEGLKAINPSLIAIGESRKVYDGKKYVTFCWNPNSTQPPNNTTIVAPNDWVAPGRWESESNGASLALVIALAAAFS